MMTGIGDSSRRNLLTLSACAKPPPVTFARAGADELAGESAFWAMARRDSRLAPSKVVVVDDSNLEIFQYAVGAKFQTGDSIVIEAEVNRHKVLKSARVLVNEVGMFDISYGAMRHLLDDVVPS